MSIPTELTDEQIEHLAYGIAIGLWCEPAIEADCDAALRGDSAARGRLLDMIINDSEMRFWMARGANLGYCSRRDDD